MKWLSYFHPQNREIRGGLLFRNHVVDLAILLDFPDSPDFPDSNAIQVIDVLREKGKLLTAIDNTLHTLRNMNEPNWEQWVQEQENLIIPFHRVRLAAPLPVPSSFRDFYAFEEHVRTCRVKRGLDMVEQWYHAPVFYFSNHQAMIGPEAGVRFPKASHKWDFELEVGIVIGKEGKDIQCDHAYDHVFGLTILNDWSARDIQAEEVKVGLGPAKGKDFATSMGPFIVTLDEWRDRVSDEQIDLAMTAMVNGTKISNGNLNQLYYSIPQLVERASRDCTLYPGDLLGTGTVGTGCFLEQENPRWLQSGDVVELKIERLGVLRNKVV